METDKNILKSSDYKAWLTDLKLRIRQSQIKAAVRINSEMIQLYWSIGADIVAKQANSEWGSGIIKQLSADLRAEFPDMQGFSDRNLRSMKQFYLFYTQEDTIVQQPVGQIPQQVAGKLEITDNQDVTIWQQVGAKLEDHPIFQIPWRHHVEIISKCKSVKEAIFYVRKTIENGWSRAMLMNFMSVGLYETQGKSVNNFSKWLPDVQSDLAKETLKNPYNLGFVTLTEGYKERELENALSTNITKFLLELGQGFSFVGRQILVKAGTKDLFLDMLFYHLKLRCYIVIELKAREFEPAFIGQLGTYVAAVNHQMRDKMDNDTIGLLICKTKDNVLAQYALEGSSQPIGISEYELANLLPENFKSALPSIEEIEERLREE
ncbi:MAG: PDDEXK nuclease domain-containing protein [Prevotellaceae bacterium]|jgi:predicted nuclease of restriction endonuclease-like (RecB) superfamily|nr:PDDEXK nuclease domain-containing protein [Prevotellaceae bacterium]